MLEQGRGGPTGARPELVLRPGCSRSFVRSKAQAGRCKNRPAKASQRERPNAAMVRDGRATPLNHVVARPWCITYLHRTSLFGSHQQHAQQKKVYVGSGHLHATLVLTLTCLFLFAPRDSEALLVPVVVLSLYARGAGTVQLHHHKIRGR